MGQWAVQYLLDHAQDGEFAPVQQTIPCRLVERASA
jgi:DNA-binding LacI/PurR family transcriptional regulator